MCTGSSVWWTGKWQPRLSREGTITRWTRPTWNLHWCCLITCISSWPIKRWLQVSLFTSSCHTSTMCIWLPLANFPAMRSFLSLRYLPEFRFLIANCYCYRQSVILIQQSQITIGHIWAGNWDEVKILTINWHHHMNYHVEIVNLT